MQLYNDIIKGFDFLHNNIFLKLLNRIAHNIWVVATPKELTFYLFELFLVLQNWLFCSIITFQIMILFWLYLWEITVVKAYVGASGHIWIFGIPSIWLLLNPGIIVRILSKYGVGARRYLHWSILIIFNHWLNLRCFERHQRCVQAVRILKFHLIFITIGLLLFII